MRTYFFGDIHGNSPALDAVIGHARSVSAHEAVCLGDIVGWLPFGHRTLARMEDLGLPAVAGNHDLLAAGLMTDDPEARDRIQATAYTAGLLWHVPGAVERLSRSPLAIERKNLFICHHSPFTLPPEGEPATIASFGYLGERELAAALPAWRAFPQRVIVSGHDHDPAVCELTESDEVIVHRPPREGALTVPLPPASRFWVKVGATGGPYRDRVPRANSALLDDEAETLTLFRIPYDTAALAAELAAHRFFRNIPTIRELAALLSGAPPA